MSDNREAFDWVEPLPEGHPPAATMRPAAAQQFVHDPGTSCANASAIELPKAITSEVTLCWAATN